jgi:hypothetical protein
MLQSRARRIFLLLIGLSEGMRSVIQSSLLIFAFSLCAAGSNSSQEIIGDPFDNFGDVNCESEMARLDNWAIQLHNSPNARGAIVFFAGKMAGDRLPKRGEAEARVERLKSYLIKRRGVRAADIVVLNGGYDEYYRVQLWTVWEGTGLPKPERSSSVKETRYRKGRLNPRDYRCGA